MPSEQRADAALSEDELARLMIERIARQVDLETGRVPLATEDEPSADDPAPNAIEETAAEPAEEPEEATVELSDEDVSRDLVERIARQVDEESHG